LIVQLAIVYWLAGWAKWNDAWLHEDALGNVFKFGLYGLPLGAALSDYPALTRFFSRATVWFELLGPLLLFIPWRVSLLRMLAFVGFVALHIGIAVTMTVGLFSYAAIAVWMAILPAAFWDRFAAFRRPIRSEDSSAPAESFSQRFGQRCVAVVSFLLERLQCDLNNSDQFVRSRRSRRWSPGRLASRMGRLRPSAAEGLLVCLPGAAQERRAGRSAKRPR
jgi:hypothetical protein